MRFASRPDLRLACVFFYDVVEVELQSFDIRFLYSFEDVDNDASEAVFIEVHFLVIRHLTNFAIAVR